MNLLAAAAPIAIGLAALTVPAAVSSQALPEGGFTASSAFAGQWRSLASTHGSRFTWGRERRFDRGFDCGVRGDRHHHHGGRDRFDACAIGPWAYYDQDINRSWDPDSFNDWWHDRPDRAFPRWVRQGRRDGDCEPERMWWSGSGWHC